MSKKMIALLAAAVFVGLGLSYGLTNAFAAEQAKSPKAQQSCCGHCTK